MLLPSPKALQAQREDPSPLRILYELKSTELGSVKALHLPLPAEQVWAKVNIYQWLGITPVC